MSTKALQLYLYTRMQRVVACSTRANITVLDFVQRSLRAPPAFRIPPRVTMSDAKRHTRVVDVALIDKPQANLLIDRARTPLVTDFGLVTVVRDPELQ
jgi:hypothetical protein